VVANPGIQHGTAGKSHLSFLIHQGSLPRKQNLGYLTARPSKALSEINFSALHLLADHMVLILEGARGLLATIEGLIDHHDSSIGSTPGFLARKTRDALKYRLRYVQSITQRGTTFEKRISNMISLVSGLELSGYVHEVCRDFVLIEISHVSFLIMFLSKTVAS
jgi:hypothetical protein